MSPNHHVKTAMSEYILYELSLLINLKEGVEYNSLKLEGIPFMKIMESPW